VVLVQLLLPLRDNRGEPFPRAAFDAVMQELTDRFGGVTGYLRSPAAGLWADGDAVDRDQMVMLEVMCEAAEPEWWRGFRESLERRFRQERIMVRAIAVDPL
jgi:hypothetical protein